MVFRGRAGPVTGAVVAAQVKRISVRRRGERSIRTVLAQRVFRYLLVALPVVACGRTSPAYLPLPENQDSAFLTYFRSDPETAARVVLSVAPFEGLSSVYSDDLVHAIAQDTAVIRAMAEILRYERECEACSGSLALWWISKSGDPRYVDLFLDWAPPDYPWGAGSESYSALEGLTRSASKSAVAHRRLGEVAGHARDSKYRHAAIGCLISLNDQEARRVLESISTEGLSDRAVSAIEAVLANEPCEAGLFWRGSDSSAEHCRVPRLWGWPCAHLLATPSN